MVMENPEGDWAVERLRPQSVLYVPPRWAHRTVNTSSSEDLVTFFVYPGDAGHDYGSIEKQGYRKLVVEQGGAPAIVDNPRWLPPEKRS
jgi:glucose-6-phosphate isomerase